ncbi:MAG: PD40 domain-containing protein [Calditrichaceae bacterium]|nr:PD40 domain-containing protein [Calditrichaceae bacterium]MBN2709184.1 PD40 domain-containing protein [Calditrichaceae bacterium]
MRRIVPFLILMFVWTHFSAAQFLQYNHPELQWQTFNTEHFTFHFHNGTKNTALIVAKIAEDIYPHVTKTYNYYPKDKIHFVIKDVDDYSNGGAFFFDNKVEIWATNLDYVMRGTKNWLRDVVTHEFVHMISIQAMVKTNLNFPYGFFQAFGYEPEKRKDVVRGFPNVVVSYPLSSVNIPIWFAEGTAQHQVDSSRYDYRDPHRDMILRDRILNDQMLTYNEMTVFGKNSHGNESSYNLGFAFVNYLTDVYDEEILEKITHRSAKWSSYSFEGVLKKVLNRSADSLYQDWVNYLAKSYSEKTSRIRNNTVKGKAVENEGFANLYPVWSPDGTKIAYVSNKNSDYFGYNQLIVKDIKTGKDETVSAMVTSSLSWSPDGRYLIYAKDQTNKHRSIYHDLMVYDFEAEDEIVLTKNMRGTNPDFSHDGKKIVFVSSSNGLHQLNILHRPVLRNQDKTRKAYFEIETGLLVENIKEENNKYRIAEYYGDHIEQLIAFPDGRQIYHPRWSNDDKKIVFDTATDYGRDIAEYDLEKKAFTIIIKGREEFRYPSFQPDSDYLYYSASLSGLYNIYRKNLVSGETQLITNVPGGAFMPSVNKNGRMVYALYDSIGYKIYTIDDPVPVDPALAVYDENYPGSVPEKDFDNTVTLNPEVKPYRSTFPKLHILPRLLIDYGTIKPGFYVVSNDVLDKYLVIGGFAVNKDFEYDAYGYFEYRELQPTLFFEIYNINATIVDTLNLAQNETDYVRYDRDVSFNLMEMRFGLQDRLLDAIDAQLNFVWRRYSAKIDQKSTYNPYNFTTESGWVFRYDYLKGWAIETSLTMDAVKTDVNQHINPTGGRYVYLKYSYESSDFMYDFIFDVSGGNEAYKNYFYNQILMDWEEYFASPLSKNHGLSLRLRAGYIDRRVDDFFNLFAGGLIGMRGYSYFSIEGRQKLIGSVSYRFPVWSKIDALLGHIYLDKLYMGLFYDYGNAWDGKLDWADFKQDVGFQLRLNTFSNSLFPTRFFFEAAYPLKSITNKNVNVKYQQDWRFYFGILFEFDIRERLSQPARKLPVRKYINQ